MYVSLLERLLSDDFERRFDGLTPLPFGVLENGRVESGLLDGLQCIRRWRRRRTTMILSFFFACSIANSAAHGHFVVLGEDRVDPIAVGLKPVFHQRDGFGPVPFGRLFGE